MAEPTHEEIDIYGARFRKISRWADGIGSVVSMVANEERRDSLENKALAMFSSLSLLSPNFDGKGGVESTYSSDRPFAILPVLPRDGDWWGRQFFPRTQAFAARLDRPTIVLPPNRRLTDYEKFLVLTHEFTHCQDFASEPEEITELPITDRSAMSEWRAYKSGTELMKQIDGETMVEWIDDHADRIWRNPPQTLSLDSFGDFPGGTVIARSMSRPSKTIINQLFMAVQDRIITERIDPDQHKAIQIRVASSFTSPEAI